MKRIFLGGKNDPTSVLRSMGSIYERNNELGEGNDYYYGDGNEEEDMRFIEVWDYVGGTCFRGFVEDKKLPRGRVEKTLFLFFEAVGGTQLKPGLMALIELASECFACDRLVICLERNAPGLRKISSFPSFFDMVPNLLIDGLVRDLGWVGFELITLSHWVQSDPIPTSGSFSSTSTMSSVFSEDDITSEKWLFMGMEV